MAISGCLGIHDISKYLGTKRSTLYLKVVKHEIPFYRFGRLIRFKKEDLDLWTEHFKHKGLDSNSKAKRIIEKVKRNELNIDKIVKKTVEEVKALGYNDFPAGTRPNQKAGKEAKDGAL
ncbi:MAG TPA: excisionase family DNA-binding protein [Thermodesulfobacteriota bacterium]|nr:excisionase family DNA-binding protein [Thermodesulfobacteriota bacterium]